MGAWGLGPFDNDTAGDWGYELDEAIPSERSAVLRKALTAAADETGYVIAGQPVLQPGEP